MKKNLRSILFVVIGAAAIILSIVAFQMNNGYHESSQRYGGDAYTGIQNAAATTANNIRYLINVCRFGFGSILLIGGATLCVVGATAMVKSDDEKEKQYDDSRSNALNALEENEGNPGSDSEPEDPENSQQV